MLLLLLQAHAGGSDEGSVAVGNFLRRLGHGISGTWEQPQPDLSSLPKPNKEAVLHDLAAYRRLLRRLEDLEDALTLDRSEDSSKGLVSYQRVRNRPKRAGKL